MNHAEYPQQLVTCRKCGHHHYATICPLCKVPTEHLAVMRPLFTPHAKHLEKHHG